MKGLDYTMHTPMPFLAALQRFSSFKSLSKVYGYQAIARLHKQDSTKKATEQEKPMLYIISILHRKPEFGEGVRFRSTYYAEETKDAAFVKRVFSEAFQLAHPSWIIEEVTVEPIS
jgi:hypothetical protein